jgi:hypothetical protein
LFRRGKKLGWSLEYEDSVYKVYDSAKRLAGYFFPNYAKLDRHYENGNEDNVNLEEELDENKAIELMNKRHRKVQGGNLMLPMLKLNLLDNQDGMEIDDVVDSLDRNIRAAGSWKNWLLQNSNALGIVGSLVYTAREDRNMLSILLGIKSEMILGEKELVEFLIPLLNKLHEDSLL